MYCISGSETAQADLYMDDSSSKENRIITFLNSIMDRRVVIFMIFFMFLMLCSLLFVYQTSKAKLPEENTRRVVSIKLEKGDTLWSLAKKYYTEDFKSLDAYINVLIRCNGLTTETIHEGRYLIVPYYADN